MTRLEDVVGARLQIQNDGVVAIGSVDVGYMNVLAALDAHVNLQVFQVGVVPNDEKHLSSRAGDLRWKHVVGGNKDNLARKWRHGQTGRSAIEERELDGNKSRKKPRPPKHGRLAHRARSF